MQKTKDKILNVVIQYIKENENIENITISKLAKRAGIGKSTIYEHFESKEDIITQTYNHLLNKYKNILSSEIQGTDFKSAFIEQVSKIHTVMKDASTIMDALMKREHKVFDNIGPEGKSCAKNIKTQVEKRFKDIFVLGIKEGLFTVKTKTKYKENIIQSIVSGLLFQYVNNEIKITKERLFELIYEQVLLVIKN